MFAFYYSFKSKYNKVIENLMIIKKYIFKNF